MECHCCCNEERIFEHGGASQQPHCPTSDEERNAATAAAYGTAKGISPNQAANNI